MSNALRKNFSSKRRKNAAKRHEREHRVATGHSHFKKRLPVFGILKIFILVGLVAVLWKMSLAFLTRPAPLDPFYRRPMPFAGSASRTPGLPSLNFLTEPRFTYRARRGDSLAPILLTKGGLTIEQSTQFVEEYDSLFSKNKLSNAIRVGQDFAFVFDSAAEVERVSTTIDALTRAVFVKTDGVFVGSIEKAPVSLRERVATGLIRTSFAQAAVDSGVNYSLIDDFVDLFSNRVEFRRDLRKGDRFTIIYKQQVLDDGTPISPGPILAAALDVGGERLVATRYVGTDGKSRYFNEKGELIGNAFLRYPLTFSRISSYFSTSRFHPVLKTRRPHNGVDFAAPVGTPVRSVADGVVVFSGRKGPNGLLVKLKHGPRYATAYAHLSKIDSSVKKGAKVRRGQVIGGVGATGRATGPHLHYAFYDNGRYVDPLKIKLPTIDALGRGEKISSRYLKRVIFTMHHYQNLEIPEPS